VIESLHIDRDALSKSMKGLCVGQLADAIPLVDAEFLELHHKYTKQGLFKPNPFFYVAHFLHIVGFYVLAYLCAVCDTLLGLCMFGLGLLLVRLSLLLRSSAPLFRLLVSSSPRLLFCCWWFFLSQVYQVLAFCCSVCSVAVWLALTNKRTNKQTTTNYFHHALVVPLWYWMVSDVGDCVSHHLWSSAGGLAAA
jgi:hypothetical protein